MKARKILPPKYVSMQVYGHCVRKDLKPLPFDWAPNLSIREAALAVATAFGHDLTIGSTFYLHDEFNKMLLPDATLVDSGISDGDDVFLVIAGGDRV